MVAFAYSWYRPGRFTDVSILGALLFLEVLCFCVWHYRRWFYAAVVLSFLWTAVALPFHSAFDVGRWVLLGVGAAVGFVTLKNGPFWRFSSFHLVASFCVLTAGISAIAASYPTVVLAKSASLFLLFLYGATGARLAVLGREDQFFHGLVLGFEIMVYLTAFCYFLLGLNLFDNGNSLGTAMSMGAFPVLLWAFLASDGGRHTRMLVALLTCCGLLLFSLERAGILAALVVGFVWCLALRRYKLLAKSALVTFFGISLIAIFAPSLIQETVTTFTDTVLYKGEKEKGLLGSRRSPWDDAVADIKSHPFFGNGFGVSPHGNLYELETETFHSTYQLARENGSSYLAIMGWLGFLGLIPFVALLSLVVGNIIRACKWVGTHGSPYHYCIPLAMTLVAGLIHAGFEDWLFAVGSYPSVYFWTLAFILVDVLPPSSVASRTRRTALSPAGDHRS
jgi:O-antigen ligase